MKLTSYFQNDILSYGVILEIDKKRFVLNLPTADESLPQTIESFLALGEQGIQRVQNIVHHYTDFPLTEWDAVRPAPVCPNAQKILCVGLNYADHVRECDSWELPTTPVIFNKTLNALAAHKDSISMPSTTQYGDFEAELVVVIGKTGKNIPESEAMEYVAGYTCGNDLTARDWQFGCPGKQWFLGKSFDRFAPVGPWIVTKDELLNPQSLGIRSILNGQVMQDSNTQNFIFSIPRVISHISQGLTLHPGDLLFTGTPPGIGYGRKPPIVLKPGDVIEIEIDDIGKLVNKITG